MLEEVDFSGVKLQSLEFYAPTFKKELSMNLKRLMASFLLLGLLAACGTTAIPDKAMLETTVARTLNVKNRSDKPVWTDGNFITQKGDLKKDSSFTIESGKKFRVSAWHFGRGKEWRGCDATAVRDSASTRGVLRDCYVNVSDGNKTVSFGAHRTISVTYYSQWVQQAPGSDAVKLTIDRNKTANLPGKATLIALDDSIPILFAPGSGSWSGCGSSRPVPGGVECKIYVSPISTREVSFSSTSF